MKKGRKQMRKKNLSVKVAALAMSGTLAMAPMTVRADEAAGTTATESTEITETAAANTSAATVSSTGATVGGATASVPAESTTTPAAGSSGTASGTPATATSGAITAAPTTVTEAPADPGTTAPNNVDTVVSDDDKQGTDIQFSGKFIFIPAENSINATISPEKTKNGETLAELPGGFNSISTFSDIKAEDMIMKGDLSIAKDGASSYDSTKMDAHSVDKEESYSLKADLDVSSVSKALTASEGIGKNIVPGSISWYLGYNDININDTYVNNLTTGFRTVVQMDNNLDGSFYRPKDLEDAKQHYELSSADGKPMIYRINYGNSSFSEKKVSIAMDLDLTKMTPLVNQYTGDKVGLENLYGTGNKIENFRHPSNEHKYNTSVFGNLRNLVNSSAQTIQLVMKGIKLKSASDNRVETETSSTTPTENITEKTITTKGSFKGTLVGYMNADVGHDNFKGKVSYKWGAIQNDAGRDSVAGKNNDKVYLTVKFTEKERTVTPITPVNPVQPVNPGNGGNGGGDRTPIIPTVTPVVTPNENTPADPGQVLGVDRPVSVDNAVSVEEKKGEVLGATRPSTKAVATRATVSTGDNHYSALWASLFGLSLASLAGFVVLRKKEQI